MNRLLAIGMSAGLGVAILGAAGVAFAQMPPPAQEMQGQNEGPGPRGPMGWRHHMMRFADRGSSFHFRRGDEVADIRCSSEEPVQACVTAATTLMDKLHANAQPAPKPAQ